MSRFPFLLSVAAALVNASVQLPLEVAYPLQNSTTATVTVGTLNSDPVYLQLQLSNLEFEYIYTVTTSATSNGTNGLTLPASAASLGIVVGQSISCNTAGSYPLNTKVTAVSGTSVTLSQNTTNLGNGTVELFAFYTAAPEASIQINSHTAINLTSDNLTFDAKTLGSGGLGGGIQALNIASLTVPNAQLNSAASNTITLNFLETDGNTSAVRILGFQLYQDTTQGSGACTAAHLVSIPANTTGCTALISTNQFIAFNPTTFVAPFTDSTDINAGLTAYQTATLTDPVAGGGSTVSTNAHCSDCHTKTGYDLKYFNYSPLEIEARSQFHGLSSTVSQQIASYIMSLTSPNPGTPWNPVYQPGPGIAEGPVANWAAGSGLSGVLTNDAAMLPYLFPTLSQQDWNPATKMTQQDIPLPYIFQDWNQWLPKTCPCDFASSTWNSSGSPLLDYNTLVGELTANSPSNYSAHAGDIANFTSDRQTFHIALQDGYSSPPTYTQMINLYSLSQWYMTKAFELNHIYGLEGEAASSGLFPSAVKWAWDFDTFNDSPALSVGPGDAGLPGIANGQPQAFHYLSIAWYAQSLLLNNGYHTFCTQNPIDWNYMYGFVNSVTADWQQSDFLYVAYMHLMNEQVMYGSAMGGSGCSTPWEYTFIDPMYFWRDNLYNPLYEVPLPQSQITAIFEGFAKMHLNVLQQFTPAEWYASTGDTASSPVSVSCWDCTDPASQAAMWIPRLQAEGVDSGTIDGFISYYQNVFPSNGYNWWGLKSSTCSTSGGFNNTCSSESAGSSGLASPTKSAFACVNGGCAAMN